MQIGVMMEYLTIKRIFMMSSFFIHDDDHHHILIRMMWFLSVLSQISSN